MSHEHFSHAWPRNSIGRFSLLMEERLVEHDHRVGWSSIPSNNLLGRARRRLDKVKGTRESELTHEQVDLLLDVANYIMMAVDNHEEPERRTPPLPGPGVEVKPID